MTEDKKIWDAYKRGVAATKKKAVPAAAKTIPAGKKPPRASSRPTAAANPPARHMFDPLERSRERAMRQGDVEIEAKLDLHGMRQAEAFDALAGFVQKNAGADKRQLLIITGKGRAGDGVLRKNLEAWLTQLPEAKRVLALRPAAVRHGGSGAFYLLLRKKQDTAR